MTGEQNELEVLLQLNQALDGLVSELDLVLRWQIFIFYFCFLQNFYCTDDTVIVYDQNLLVLVTFAAVEEHPCGGATMTIGM